MPSEFIKSEGVVAGACITHLDLVVGVIRDVDFIRVACNHFPRAACVCFAGCNHQLVTQATIGSHLGDRGGKYESGEEGTHRRRASGSCLMHPSRSRCRGTQWGARARRRRLFCGSAQGRAWDCEGKDWHILEIAHFTIVKCILWISTGCVSYRLLIIRFTS